MNRSLPTLTCIALLLGSISATAELARATDPHWITTWSAPADTAGPALPAQTVRQSLRTSVGGTQVRVRFSNRYGRTPLTLGPAHIARHAQGSAIVAGSDRQLTFAGKSTLTLAPGAEGVSDAMALPVAALQELAVSVYLPNGTTTSTLHALGRQTAFFASGDATVATRFPNGPIADVRLFVTDVEVAATAQAQALVIIGDSIADGFSSTPDRNARWPDALAVRLQVQRALQHIAVINSGISGNRLLQDGPAGDSVLTRFAHDALDKPGVRWVLLQAGINDIGMSEEPETPADVVSAQQITDGMQALATRAHAKGLRIWAATLLPCEGSPLCASTGAETKRQVVNAWLRNTHAFDAVVDFDARLRDPTRPQRLLPALDSGDHLHPNDAGYAAMAKMLDLGLFKSMATRRD